MASHSSQINVWNITRWYKGKRKANEHLYKYGKQSMLDNSWFRNIWNDNAFLGRQKSNWQNASKNKCHEMQITSWLWGTHICNKWIWLHASKWWLGWKKCWIWSKPRNLRIKAKSTQEKFTWTNKSCISRSINNRIFDKSWKWASARFNALVNVKLSTEHKFINTNWHEDLRWHKWKRINNKRKLHIRYFSPWLRKSKYFYCGRYFHEEVLHSVW